MQNTFQDVKMSVVMWCLDGISIQETGASTGQFSSHWKPNGMVQCGPLCSMSQLAVEMLVQFLYSPTEGIDALGDLNICLIFLGRILFKIGNERVKEAVAISLL